MKAALEKFGADRIVAGLDGKFGRAAVSGWEKESDFDIIDLALKFKEYKAGIRQLLEACG